MAAYSGTDYLLSREDSEKLMENIKTWWAKNFPARTINVWIETEIRSSGQKFHYVRSDIVQRVPRR